MLATLMYLIMLSSLMFFCSNSPINLVILVIFLSFVICLMLKVMFFTSWFSYILFLIFLGGLMVLFIYICSLASNEQATISFNWLIIFTWVMSIFMGFKLNVLKFDVKPNLMSLESMLSVFNQDIIYIAILYLLLTLFVSVQITKMKFGPVRTKKL